MTILNLERVFRLNFLLFATGLIFCQKTSGQGARTVTSNSLESSYFFYQQSEYPRDCREVSDQCGSNNSSGVHFIKPEGYKEPFEVYCDSTADSSGWTVVSRRSVNGIISFERDWESYKTGFGFLGNEFWIGNERLSYLTNQKRYQLVIEMTLLDGSTVNVSYGSFRIGDEFSKYKLISIDYIPGGTDNLPGCPENMVFGNCTCGQKLCQEPTTCQNTCVGGHLSEGCICPEGYYMSGDNCVPQEQCGCYISEELRIVPENGTYTNSFCTRTTACIDGSLIVNDNYQCSPNAVCREKDGTSSCQCNSGYSGDGETCIVVSTDCQEVYDAGNEDDGVYMIRPTNWHEDPFEVYCNMTEGRQGWTVFQRRIDGSVEFDLDWVNYTKGFGSAYHEHWLGNEKLYSLTNQRNYEIRIDMVYKDGTSYYATYDSFRINDADDKYRLSSLGSYSGTSPGGGWFNYGLVLNRGQRFTTRDQDNDAWSSGHCGHTAYFSGGWWYNDCGYSGLNGIYSTSDCSLNSIVWSNDDCSFGNLLYTEMKIRPV